MSLFAEKRDENRFTSAIMQIIKEHRVDVKVGVPDYQLAEEVNSIIGIISRIKSSSNDDRDTIAALNHTIATLNHTITENAKDYKRAKKIAAVINSKHKDQYKKLCVALSTVVDTIEGMSSSDDPAANFKKLFHFIERNEVVKEKNRKLIAENDKLKLMVQQKNDISSQSFRIELENGRIKFIPDGA